MIRREDADRVYNSIINGQHKQAVAQLIEIGLDSAPDVLDYLAKELNQPETAIKLAKSYFRSLC